MANYLSDYSFKGTVVNVWLLQQHYHEQSCVFDIVRKKNFLIRIYWEPSDAWDTKVTCRLPVLERFYQETKFSLFKSTHSI